MCAIPGKELPKISSDWLEQEADAYCSSQFPLTQGNLDSEANETHLNAPSRLNAFLKYFVFIVLIFPSFSILSDLEYNADYIYFRVLFIYIIFFS